MQLYKNNARVLLSRILSIVNSDWLQHACSLCGVYEYVLSSKFCCLHDHQKVMEPCRVLSQGVDLSIHGGGNCYAMKVTEDKHILYTYLHSCIEFHQTHWYVIVPRRTLHIAEMWFSCQNFLKCFEISWKKTCFPIRWYSDDIIWFVVNTNTWKLVPNKPTRAGILNYFFRSAKWKL